MYSIILTLSNNLNPQVKLTKQQYHTQYKNQDDYEGCFYQWVVGYLRYICIETNVAQQLMTKIINYHSVDVCLRTSENQSDFSVPKHNHVCIFMPTLILVTYQSILLAASVEADYYKIFVVMRYISTSSNPWSVRIFTIHM